MGRRTLRMHARTQALMSASLAALAAAAFASPAAAGTGAHYGITISKHATHNVTFANGVYTAIGAGAVLDVKDLTKALRTGNVEVTTGNGAGGTEDGDIHVRAALRWTGSFGLTLDAYHSLFIQAAVSDTGTGALTLTTNDGGSGGTFIYSAGGSITIWDLSDILTIDGQVYTLAGDLPTLAGDIAANPTGFYALANSYDAGKDGTYTASPLGNTLSNLTIASTQSDAKVGLFAELSNETVRDFVLSSASVSGAGSQNASEYVGALVGYGQNSTVSNVTVSSTVSAGTATNVYLGGVAGYLTGGTLTDIAATANVSGGVMSGGVAGYSTATVTHATAAVTMTLGTWLGGLIGENSGTVSLSSASGTIGAKTTTWIGGLIGFNAGGTVSQCFATASATGGIDFSHVGGLIGNDEGTVENSYAEGAVTIKKGEVGGFAGSARGNITSSYSAGAVSGKPIQYEGGFIGEVEKGEEPAIATSYWDLTTSGLGNPHQGVGNVSDYPGLTALTSTQLRAGLPSGFDSSVWAQSPSINNGFPYLIANPPQ
jgi:hypothetical protein